MKQARISPSNLKGSIQVPPSKSIAHRAIICAALAEGTSTVAPFIPSDDMLATISAVRSLGALVEIQDDTLVITGTGGKQAMTAGQTAIDCIESGSTLRFLIPVCAAVGGEYRFTGKGRLPSRPIDVYLDLFPRKGVLVQSNAGLPLTISGKLKPDTYVVRGDVSSQYITGLLLALPLLDGESEIWLSTKLESKDYVAITIDVMKTFGVQIEQTEQGWKIPGNQTYGPCDYTVEPDWSQAAFFLCAAALGHDITVKNMRMDSLQGDRAIIQVLEQMGATFTETPDGLVCTSCDLQGTQFDASDIPDLVPVLAMTAAFAKGETTITGCARLRLKESDRLAATQINLRALGADAQITDDSISIPYSPHLTGCPVKGFNDHRIVMALSIAATRMAGETIISDAQSIAKSYPGFFADYTQLGGVADVL